MKTENEVKVNEPIHQKIWLMWLLLIIFPQVGVVFLWLQQRLSKIKKIIITIIADVYFISPFILIIILLIVWNPTIPLYHSHDEFVEAFNQEIQEQDLPYNIQVTEEEKHLITSELGQDITLLENIDEDGNVRELIMIGQGAGTDIIHMIGILIETTNPKLEKYEIGQVLEELRLFDGSYDFDVHELTVEQDQIRYNLKYDESIGIIFSVSKVNEK